MNAIERITRRTTRALLLLLTLWATACSNTLPLEPAHEPAPPAAQIDPANVTFAEVRANGTGCPPGTANTRISSDGLVFTTTFSSYVAQVDPSSDLSVRDCSLDITLRTPEGRSYAVQTFSYSGYALLQEGVIGRQTANYYFQGNPVAPVETNRTQMVGPHDKGYLFRDQVQVEDRVWSPCGVERNLNVVTRVQVFNSEPRRTGYLNLSTLDGSSELKLVLASKPCEGATPPPRQPLAKVTQVTLTPNSVERDQPFAVRWQAPAQNTDATYTVELRTQASLGDALVWSRETPGTSVVYDGPALDTPGTYEVLVLARRGDEAVRSDRTPLTVRERPGAVPALGKPTALRVSPSPIVRDQPFVVTWSRSDNATPATLYRVEIHEPESAGFALVTFAPDTPATIAALPASALPKDGKYQVVVVARDATTSVPSDALTVDAVSRVTSPSVPTPPPTSPNARLLGRYATRAVGYSTSSRDSQGKVKELGLAEIVEGPRGLELRHSLCAQETRSLGFDFSMSRPEAYPVAVRDIRVEGDRWYTIAEPIGTGFERAGVAACRGRAGQYIARQPSQRWLSNGSCRCPTSAATIPTYDDCRVTDPDGDGHPGLAYRGYGAGGALEYTWHLGTVLRTTLRNGTIASDGRHVADLRYDETTYSFSCEGLLCRAGNSVGSGWLPCASRYNRFEFTPLPDPPQGQPRWTCPAVRSAEARLFPHAVIAPPSERCEVEPLTDPQQF